MVSVVFCITYAVWFKKRILERINKEILMIWTLIFLYVMFQTLNTPSTRFLLVPITLASLVAIVNAFAGFDENYGWKVYFYVWFLCIIVAVAASRFSFSVLMSIFWHDKGEIDSWAVFFVGMAFPYLAINAWYVLELVPLPGKHQSLSERMEEVAADLEILAEDYEVETVRRWKTAVLLACTASLLAANYFGHFVDDVNLIPVLIAMSPVMDKLMNLGMGLDKSQDGRKQEADTIN